MLTPSIASNHRLQSSAINTAPKPKYSGLPERSNVEINVTDSFLLKASSNFLSSRNVLVKKKLALNRNNPHTLMQIANTHMIQGRISKAIDVYLSVLKVDDRFLSAYEPLIDALIVTGQLERAIQQSTRGLNVSGGNPNILLKQLLAKLVLAINTNDDEVIQGASFELEKDFIDALAKYENDSELLNLHGLYYALVIKDFKAASKVFEKNLTFIKDHVDSQNNLALCYLELGRVDDAIDNLKLVMKNHPKYPNAYANLINILEKKNQPVEALSVLEQSIENSIVIFSEEDLIRAQLLVQAEDYGASLEAHLKLVLKYKNNYRFLNNLGFCYEKTGNYNKALKYYEQSVSILLKQKRIRTDEPLHQFYNLMLLARAMNNQDLVQQTAKRLMSINPEDVAAYYFLNNEGIGRGTADFAKEALKKRIHIDKNDAQPYASLSFIQTCIDNEYEEAIDLIKSAPKNVQRDMAVFNNLAYAYVRSGRLEEATSMLVESAIGDNTHLNATRGLLELYKNNITAAKEFFNKAINQTSDDNASQSFVNQVWQYEQGNYYAVNGNKQKAKKHLNIALSLGDSSYAYEDAKALLKTLGE